MPHSIAGETKEQKGKQFIEVTQLGLEPRPSNFQETAPFSMPFAPSFSLIPSSNKCYGTPTAPQGMGIQPRAKETPCLLELRSGERHRQETDNVASVYCKPGGDMYFFLARKISQGRKLATVGC